MCSGPLIPPEREGLPSVQWAPHPSLEKIYPVCSGPFIPPERGGLGPTQCAVGPSSLLRDEV